MRSVIFRILLIVTVVLPSCKKDGSDNYTWVVSIEKEFSLNETYIDNLFSSASAVYEEIVELQPLISDGVNVYRVVYRTETCGKPVNASGLICIPLSPGEYPVLSFQNGTNTVDAYSPGNFPLNTSYQMVEALASMGYIVVIPDYPGFGESSSVTHPYLISEPTTRAVVDMFHALEECAMSGLLPGITVKNEYYLMGYSQGGWATMALHKALENDFAGDFNLAGSVCGAGPYDINYLFQSIISAADYPVPAYFGYIIYAYSEYDQFSNPVTDILNQSYASLLSSLYNGTHDLDYINSQLTTSVSGLFTQSFLSGYDSSPAYASVREAMSANSISPWHTLKPLLMVHGGSDTQVDPQVTEYFYNKMIDEGSSATICKKEILPGLDHGDGVVPAMVMGVQFLKNAGTGE